MRTSPAVLAEREENNPATKHARRKPKLTTRWEKKYESFMRTLRSSSEPNPPTQNTRGRGFFESERINTRTMIHRINPAIGKRQPAEVNPALHSASASV